jgi:Transglycosylase SLT domain
LSRKLSRLGRALGAVAAASIAQLVQQAATQYGLDPGMVLRLAQTESNLNPNAVSPAGAKGVMQLLDSTAAALGVSNPFDPTQNISAGVRYLAQLISQFGDLVEGVAAYNWGPGNVSNAVARYGADWLGHAPAETQNYVQRILGVTPPPPDTSTPPVTIDAATGQVIPDTTDVTALPPAIAYASGLTQNQILVLTGLAVGAYLLADLLTSD